MFHRSCRTAALLCLGALLCQGLSACLANAQDPTLPADQGLDREAIQKAVEAVKQNSELTEEERKELVSRYEKALELLDAAEASKKRASQFAGEAELASQRLPDLRRQVGGVQDDVHLDPVLASLEQERAELQAKVDLAQKEAASLAEEPQRRQTRRAEIAKELDEAKKRLTDVTAQLALPAPATEKPATTQARVGLLTAERRSLETKIAELTTERDYFAASDDLKVLEGRMAVQRLEEARSQLAELNERIEDVRKDVGREAVRLAADDLDDAPSEPKSLKDFAAKNLEYAEEYRRALSQLKRASESLAEVEQVLSDTESDHQTAIQRVESVGLTEVLGLLLRQKRAELTKTRAKYRPSEATQARVTELRGTVFRLQDAQAEIADKQALADTFASEAAEERKSAVRGAAEDLIDARRELLTKTIQVHSSLTEDLGKKDTAQHALVQEIDAFLQDIDENILWIRSSTWEDVTWKSVSAAFAWLLNAEQWTFVYQLYGASMRQQPGVWILLALLLALSFAISSRLRRARRHWGEHAQRKGCIEIRPTIYSLLATLFLAARFPLLLTCLALPLLTDSSEGDLVEPLGIGLLVMSSLLGLAHLLQQICASHGLAEDHLEWEDGLRKLVSTQQRWVVWGVCPLVLLLSLIENQPEELYRNALGSSLSMAILFVALLMHHKLFRPKSEIYRHFMFLNPSSLIYEYRRFLYLLALSIPLALIVLVFTGFQYTALELSKCFVQAVYLFVTLTLAVGIGTRWMKLRHRKLRIEEWRRSRELQGESAVGEEAGIKLYDESEVDLRSLSQQARKLLRVFSVLVGVLGIWIVFQPVLPAIGIFDRVKVWEFSTGETIEQVTLASLISALVAALMTWVCVRNIPGVMELLVLRHTSMDSGARYAVTTICRYVVLMIGVVVSLSFISIPWSQLSWAVAAISLGVGFGLQEIVANFVSGIIVLLERPVRVGDVVTLGDTTGIVTRIQMRATTITNWDHKDLVVPNRELITGKLLNWSLTSTINRIVITVGVAYGSDTDHVRRVLLDEVKAHPDVMVDPRPMVNLEEFGDSALVFMVRCCISGLDRRLDIIHELNTAIANRFRREGIAIPFPQLDLHVIGSAQQDAPTNPETSASTR